MWLLDTVNDSDFKQIVLIFSPTSELVQVKNPQIPKRTVKTLFIYIMHKKLYNLDGKADIKKYLLLYPVWLSG